jgi:hypothetical protein
MTPARRAALKKAQAASARKRRRKNAARKVAKGAGQLGSAFLAAQTARYMANPRAMTKDYADVRNWAKGKSAARKARKNPPPPRAAQTFSSRTYQNGPWV